MDFNNRWRIQGSLTVTRPLHIGGEEITECDNLIVVTAATEGKKTRTGANQCRRHRSSGPALSAGNYPER
jgi:hypothetical protein